MTPYKRIGAQLLHPAARSRALWELAFAALVAYVAAPLWSVDYLPIQDLPQHLAAVRVLHSYGEGLFDFARYFEIDLGRTQYLTYYLAADWLAYLLDVELATRVLLTASVAATPYALRSLLRALAHDERHALFALPLVYNAHFILGFLNFLAAIPLMLWGLAQAVRWQRSPSWRAGLSLAVLCLLTFYTHVVPFGLLALGMGLLALDLNLRISGLRLAPLAPALIAAIAWSLYSPAGQATLSAVGDEGGRSGAGASYRSWMAALKDTPDWLTEVFAGETDGQLLVGWGLLWLVTLAAGASLRAFGDPSSGQGSGWSARSRVALLAPAAALAYFVTPTSYDWIWPIAPRFPLLAVYFMILSLPRLPRLPALAVTACVCVLAVGHARVAREAFEGFAEEVGDLDQALETIPEGRRVAGLIFQRHSRHVKFSPFIHAVAYYQARKGGAVMFTFADFPQSPFRFRADDRPPPVPPRWEWKPNEVDPARDLAWYEYVLVRGGPGTVARQRSAFVSAYRGRRWHVYRAVEASPQQRAFGERRQRAPADSR